MNQLKHLIDENKINHIFYFLTAFMLPPAIYNLLKHAAFSINPEGIIYVLSGNYLVFIAFQFIFFIITAVLINKFDPDAFNFMTPDKWISSFAKALAPSIIAFTAGFFISSILSMSILKFLNPLIPSDHSIKDWITAPNQGTIDLINRLISEDYATVMVIFIHIVIFTPVYEEICFRGFLQQIMEKHLKKFNLDVIITSLIFASFHLFSFSNAVFAFIAGLFLSIYKKKTGSVNIPIFMHSIINFTLLLSGIIFFYLLEFKK